jgi:hypothetical protein
VAPTPAVGKEEEVDPRDAKELVEHGVVLDHMRALIPDELTLVESERRGRMLQGKIATIFRPLRSRPIWLCLHFPGKRAPPTETV